MNRSELINQLIRKRGYRSYLEIGTFNGLNLKSVECPLKVGVDPDRKSKATLHMTSDAYFLSHPTWQFDIVFVDGLHHADQVQRDVENSLAVLKPGGAILCHDMLPSSEALQIVPRRHAAWTGDCWKAFVALRARADLSMCTVTDEPHGVAIIERGT